MKTVIHKYQVVLGGFTVCIPLGAKIISLQLQGTRPVMWASFDEKDINCEEERKFFVAGTGHSFESEDSEFIGTFQMPPYVWHLYEAK